MELAIQALADLRSENLRADEDLGPGLAVEQVDHDPPPVAGQAGAGVLDRGAGVHLTGRLGGN